MNPKYGLLSILFIFFLAFNAKADVWNRTCTNNYETNLIYNGDTLIFNSSKICLNNCSLNGYECNDVSNVDTLMLAVSILGFLMVSIIFVLVAGKIPDDWDVLPIIFYIFSLFFILISLGLIAGYYFNGQNSIITIQNTAYYIGILFVILVISYIFIRFLAKVLILLTESPRMRR